MIRFAFKLYDVGRARLTTSLLLLFCVVAHLGTTAQASFDGCGDEIELGHAFSSGASWQLCASVDEQQALRISSVHYRAPGDTARSVLQRATAAQILMHYHDESEPRAQLGDISTGRLLQMTTMSCDGSIVNDQNGEPTLCSQIEPIGILAKFAQTAAIQGEQWVLSSALQREALVWAISITFSEDGQITPATTLSGRGKPLDLAEEESADNLSSATILSTWRLVFELDDGDFDQIHQFDFVLDEQQQNRRAMQVSPVTTESFASINRTQFTGWLMSDPRGTGFYLDPSNSGFRYVSNTHNWANFDVAFTRLNDCEQYALNNNVTSSTNEPQSALSCGESLDDFMNSESLQGTHPVLWFSQSRSIDPGTEHWPVIRNLQQSFTLLPYDWTPSSPFEATE